MGCGGSKAEEPPKGTPEEEKAATKIQAVQRGKQDREKVQKIKEGKLPAQAPPENSSDEFKKLYNRFQSLTERKNKEARAEAWKACDPNGNKKVSCAEFDAFLQKYLKDQYGDEGEAIWKRFRPCYRGAHKDAADVAPGDDDYVTRREFRLALHYVILHANLFDCFLNIDGGAGVTGEDDSQVTLEEFKKAAGVLKASPFCAFTDETLDGKEEEVFKAINVEGEKILFRELIKYVEKIEADKDTNIGKLMNMGEDEDAAE
jgi:hypothetical protein